MLSCSSLLPSCLAKVETGGKGGVEVPEEVLYRICLEAGAFKRLGRTGRGFSHPRRKGPGRSTTRTRRTFHLTCTHLRESKAAGEVGQLHHFLGF
jgi:hypothetical protein